MVNALTSFVTEFYSQLLPPDADPHTENRRRMWTLLLHRSSHSSSGTLSAALRADSKTFFCGIVDRLDSSSPSLTTRFSQRRLLSVSFFQFDDPVYFNNHASLHNRHYHLFLRGFTSSSDRAERHTYEEKMGKELHYRGLGTQNDNLKGGDSYFPDEYYPSGDHDFVPLTGWKSCLVKLKMFVALPWERVQPGSVLDMKLGGKIYDQLQSSFYRARLSLPQICENFEKATYDSRISGIYLQIDTLNCGWGKLEEIRRQILNFRKSGKFTVAYVPRCQEKEYYLACACEDIYAPPSAYFHLFGFMIQASFLKDALEKGGIEPQVTKMGKYKSAADLLTCKSMPKETREMLTLLLDNIYGNWLDKVSSARGKKREDLESLINEGVHQINRLKEEGLITDIIYDDEVISILRKKLGMHRSATLPIVDYRKYSLVRKWTLGISGGKDLIAIIRASGSIRLRSTSSVQSAGISAEKLIEKIRKARVSKKIKAVIIRIDSPGGDALASDLIWREIRLLSAEKPVVASMSDIAASGGYYIAMGAGTVVAENLTLTGSIGVVSAKFNLGKLYEKIGLNRENISRGKYAEVRANQRPLSPDESELLTKIAENIYSQFLEKATLSRSMAVDEVQEVAQGRVWTGKDAVSRGLVDAIGGISRAIAIAKFVANIPQDKQVTLVELSKPSPTLSILGGMASSLAETDRTLKELLQEMESSNGVQARMDGIIFENLQDCSPSANPIFGLMRDYLSSL